MIVQVFVKVNGRKADLVGSYESVNEAVIELAEAREDNDYSMTTFRDCYIVEEIEE